MDNVVSIESAKFRLPPPEISSRATHGLAWKGGANLGLDMLEHLEAIAKDCTMNYGHRENRLPQRNLVGEYLRRAPPEMFEGFTAMVTEYLAMYILNDARPVLDWLGMLADYPFDVADAKWKEKNGIESEDPG